jgi:hypothetical protein
VIILPWLLVDEPGEENSYHKHTIIGAVWTQDYQFVAFWSVNQDDGHVDFYGLKLFKHLSDFKNITRDFNHGLNESFHGLFDDGSGLERGVRELSDDQFKCPYLETLLKK